jgi:hypothetical protein
MTLRDLRRTLSCVLENDGGTEMNHNFGLEMAKQRQADFERRADLHRQMRAAKAQPRERATRLPRLLGFRRAVESGAETPHTRREWRLSRS